MDPSRPEAAIAELASFIERPDQELVDQIDRGEELHAGAVAHAIGSDRNDDMAVAGAGPADQDVALRGEKAGFSGSFSSP